MNATDPSKETLVVGSTFIRRDARPYTENGERGVHETTVRAVVTRVDDVGFAYLVEEVLDEQGRPSFADGEPLGGSYAWFGFGAAYARGEVEIADRPARCLHRVNVVATRSTRRLAEKFVASYADVQGEQSYWDGSKHHPVTVEWTVIPDGRRFAVVSKMTPRKDS